MRGLSTPLIAALLTVYAVWGSTYYAIQLVVDELPPLGAGGFRYLAAGLCFLGLAAWRRELPGLAAVIPAARAGVPMIACGTALVFVAQQSVPSGHAALVMATTPAQFVFWAWALGGPRPSVRVVVGLVFGFLGVACLGGGPQGAIDPLGLGLLLFASTSWALGSLQLRSPEIPEGPGGLGLVFALGGVAALVLSVLRGEAFVDPASVSLSAWAALAYLVVFGCLLAGTAYAWLLRNAPVRVASSYAYVNPIVAVGLGAVLLGEPLGSRVVVAAVLVCAGTVLVLFGHGSHSSASSSASAARRCSSSSRALRDASSNFVSS